MQSEFRYIREVQGCYSNNCWHLQTLNYRNNCRNWFWPPHDKTNKMTVRPAKTRISLGICPVWSESSLSAWRKLWSLATHLVHREDPGQTGRMPWLIWVFAGHTLILLVLSCHGSFCLPHISWPVYWSWKEILSLVYVENNIVSSLD